MYCFKNSDDCPYSKICENKTSEGDCSKMCARFHEIDLLFSNANIPRRYLQPYRLFPGELDKENYDILNGIKNNILDLTKKGFNLYIVSNQKQNGKTSWAIKIIQQYFHYIWPEPGSRKRALYVDVNEYLTQIKASFNNYNDEVMKDFERDIDLVDIVIWDNIDESKLSEWERGNIKQHIKKRLANQMSNIFVGNNLDHKLSSIIGEDLKYYVQDNSIIIPLIDVRGDSK